MSPASAAALLFAAPAYAGDVARVNAVTEAEGNRNVIQRSVRVRR